METIEEIVSKLDSKYIYDPEAADRPIRFIEKYLEHTEAQHAGKPFKLMPWQKLIIRQLFGILIKKTGLRRYRYLYLEGAKSLGKTPLVTAIGLYILFAEKGDASPLIVNGAATYDQAKNVFDRAKQMIINSDQLHSRALLQQYLIKVNSRNAQWKIMSGVGKGKSGFAPSLVILDELHEVSDTEADLIAFLQGNLVKRNNSLMLISTNSGFDLNSLCGKWHTRCKNILDGISTEDDVLPAIFSAPKDADIADTSTYYLANPSIGTTITIDDYINEYRRVKTNPSQEPHFRRLWLSQWVKSEDVWLNTADIAHCIVTDLPDLSQMPLYIGLDMGVVDDITAVSFLWVDEENDKFYSMTEMWLPKDAAFRYQDTFNIPYYNWSQSNQITLTPGRTIDTAVKKQISTRIIEVAGQNKIQQICYDRFRADEIIFDLEAAGINCEPIASTFGGIGLASKQLERRIIDHSLLLTKNECLLWQMSHCSIETDNSGNIKPKRPKNGESKKIDGVMALIYAFSRGYLHALKPNDDAGIATWNGEIPFI